MGSNLNLQQKYRFAWPSKASLGWVKTTQLIDHIVVVAPFAPGPPYSLDFSSAPFSVPLRVKTGYLPYTIAKQSE